MIKPILQRVFTIILLIILFVMVAPPNITWASDAELTITAQYRQDVPVKLDVTSGSEISTLDPALASDTISVSIIENLFLGLTDVDPITGQILPELATRWDISDDGLVWTFHLRQDIQWMRYDPASDIAEKVRPVIASDFVYGIKRTCDPRLGGFYGTVAAKVIAGCDIVNQSPNDDVTDDLVYGDTTQVTAPDEATVVITLSFSSSFFFAMTPMWMFRPVPRETIAEFGDDWTAPGNIVTNGPYFIRELTRGVQRIYIRNERLPEELRHGGNIDIIQSSVSEDLGTSFALYQTNRVDSSSVPAAELQALLNNDIYQNQLLQVFDLSVFYYGYVHDKPPFDDVHIRRAFSAIIDRNAFIAQLRGGRGLPMVHFSPPGIAHAPPINEVGIGFDPDYALQELQQSTYGDCQSLPTINIVTFAGTGVWGEFWSAAAEEYLGCDSSLFTIEQVEFSVLLQMIDSSTPIQDRPNAWTLGWSPNYAHANNYLNDVLSCTAENRFQRECSEVDDLIERAARESDPTLRDELYSEIENAFFGREGIFPMVPLFIRSDYVLIKSWYSGPFETDGIFSGTHWDAQTIDMAAKLAAQN